MVTWKPNRRDQMHATRMLRVLFCSAAIAISSAAGCASLDGTVLSRGTSSTLHDGHVACPTCSAPQQCATCAVAENWTQPNGLNTVPAADAWQNGQQPVPAGGFPPACQPLSVVPAVPPASAQAEATEECERKVASLQQQIDRLVADQYEADKARDLTLQAFGRDLKRLSDEVSYWKSEVTRLDTAATAQHERDMQSLNSLIQLVEQIPVAAPPAARNSPGPEVED